MRVLVTGSRDWVDGSLVARVLSALPPGSVVVHGAARGLDYLADQAARRLGFVRIPYPISDAEWRRYGNGAGPRRNARMLDTERPDAVLAFSDHLQTSRGTKGCVRLALARGIPVECFSHAGMRYAPPD